MKGRLWLVVRIAVSVGLLVWLLHRFNLGAIAADLRSASWQWVLAAIVLTGPVILLVSWKWQILLAAAGARERLSRLVRMNLVGGFYSEILPGEETGALVKGVILARHSQGDAVAASIVVDEILGTISVFSIALVALGLTHAFPLRLPIAIALAVMTAIFVLLLILALTPSLHGFAFGLAGRGRCWLVRRLPAWAGQPIDSAASRFRVWLAPFVDRLAVYPRRAGHLAAAFAITVVAHLGADVSVYCTMRAVGANVSLLDVCWVYAAISAVVTVPATISGFGLREGANVIILGQLGVAGSTALAVSLLSFAIGFLWSMPGALLQFGIRSEPADRLGHTGLDVPRSEAPVAARR
jgi:uncharacterized protein (TIRG00374 family)